MATHYPVEDDTFAPAPRDVRSWYPRGPFIVATDLLVLNVSRRGITQRRAVVSGHAWGGGAGGAIHTDPNPPKYSSPTRTARPEGARDPALGQQPNPRMTAAD